MASIFGSYYFPENLAEVAELQRSIMKVPEPPRLFHYTSMQGAIGILRQRKLWATNAQYLNDASELSYGYELVKSVIDDRKSTANGVTRSALRNVQTIVDNALANGGVYLACLCEVSDLLSQWRGYGADGGVALGFDGAMLESVSRMLVPVVYDVDEQRELIRATLAAYEPRLLNADTNAEELFAWKEQSRFGLALALLLTVLKHPSFAEEKEWRLVALDVPITLFRVDQAWLKPYVELELTDAPQGLPPLVQVTIGPGRHALLARDSMRMFISSMNYQAVKIAESQVPLR